jgi:hypothetical protein
MDGKKNLYFYVNFASHFFYSMVAPFFSGLIELLASINQLEMPSPQCFGLNYPPV